MRSEPLWSYSWPGYVVHYSSCTGYKCYNIEYIGRSDMLVLEHFTSWRISGTIECVERGGEKLYPRSTS